MQYYILVNGESVGPMEKEALLEHGLTPESQVWCESMADWAAASTVAELMAMLNANKAPRQQQYNNPDYNTPQSEKQFGEELASATAHFFMTIVYVLFLLPFGLWAKAIRNLCRQRESGALRISKINSPWPFFSFLKVYCLEFAFDACAFISYPIGLLIGLGVFFYQVGDDFGSALAAMLGVWVISYYTPIACFYLRDAFQICIVLPFRKLISWLRKPAQYLDLKQKVEVNK